MYALDAAGLLKMDILGLRTLTVVEEATKLVRGRGRDFDIEKLPLDDSGTFKLLQRADTIGVFQLESAGMRDLCRQMMPDRIEHIIALIALYRPGPMELIPQYLARKAGKEPIAYEHPLLESICSETYGIMIYQEQVMQAAQALAGYSLGKADLLRRAMGKKRPREMAAQHDSFVEGCDNCSQIPEVKAERIFDLLAKFAGYGFNKSHAAGYAYLSYLTAYLKANFPVEFVAATLTSEIGDSKKLAKFINEARRMGIAVLGPDVNSSHVSFTLDQGRVRFGLAGVKNLGTGASELVVKERQEHGPYENLLDFLIRTKGAVNRKAAESLIKAGAFDWLEPNRTALLGCLEWEMNKAGSERLRFAERQFDIFAVRDKEPSPSPAKLDTHELLTYEKEAFGFYFSSHPLAPYQAEYEALGLSAIVQIETMRDGDKVSLGGVITGRRSRKDKRDREYAILTVEDFDGAIEVLVFYDVLEGCRAILKTDNLVAVQGTVKVRAADASGRAQGVPQVWADRVMLFSDCARYLDALVLTVAERELDEPMLHRLKAQMEHHPGNAQVYLRLTQPHGSARELRLRQYRVALTKELIAALRPMLGPDAVGFRGELPPSVRNGDRSRQTDSPKRGRSSGK
ncbi:DNA polymerase III subunit alpha, partial [candidate division WOR-3 bacterium]|nr:DNA polymerase III subunit alpha [candidate division WOR-3 bacterium]